MGRDGQERHEENEMEINRLWFRQRIADRGKVAGGLGEFILLQIFIFFTCNAEATALQSHTINLEKGKDKWD